MATTAVEDSVSSNALIGISKEATIVRSLSSDGGAFQWKSGSFELRHVKEGSIFIVSAGDGAVNPGFDDEGNSYENVSGERRLPRTDWLSDGEPGRNKKADNISVTVISPLEEQRRGQSVSNERTETKLDNISAGKIEQSKNPNSSKQLTPVDISKETGTWKLSVRDYLTAFSLFVITSITYGNLDSLPVISIEWLKEFNNSKSLILFLPNLLSGLMSAAGVIDCFLINRFGIYNMIVLGCIMQIFCVIGSSFSTNAITLVIVLGVIQGFGSCFCYVNSFILMGREFGGAGKYLIAALSLASPFCGIVFPNLIPVFVEKYAWRGSMFMLASINLQMIPLSLFLILSHKNKMKKCPKIDARTKKASSEPIPLAAPKKSFDTTLFKNPLYVAYLCAVTFTLTSVNATYGLIASFFHKKGLSLEESAGLYSVYCIVPFVPRGGLGILQRWIKIPFIYIFIALSLLSGFMCILINRAESYSSLFAVTIVLSLCMGGPSGLYSVGTLESVGVEKYSFATSVIETSYGVSTVLFGYLAGILIAATGSYQQAFDIYGSLTITSNICLLITALVESWRCKPGISEC